MKTFNTFEIKAIDAHAHYGKYCQKNNSDQMNEFMSSEPTKLVELMRQVGIQISMISPLKALTPRKMNDPFMANLETAKIMDKFPELRQWVVVDPCRKKTYSQAREILQTRQCVGIKIHPEEHGYRITELGREIFEFAEKHNAIIETHSGEENSLPEDFVVFANDFPTVKVIVSHLGCSIDQDPSHQIRAIQNSKHGNVFTDTSSAMSMTPRLIEWAVSEVGAEKILFGSDSPCYFLPMQRARIDYADITDDEKKMILRDNAVSLFRM